ncbi:hypothetical protein CBOM_07822 [Ceraceosorus bombacis]|uniref:Uncharacterized protein n=1 Tax=Ceraceosorus bombacis TaxID=401625 RepID=A0A0P1BMB8_9BASI|nr:hypothetical protein CBOM_07822 [Ceraceosorus bombacis]
MLRVVRSTVFDLAAHNAFLRLALQPTRHETPKAAPPHLAALAHNATSARRRSPSLAAASIPFLLS